VNDYKVIVCAIVRDPQGRILLCRRKPEKVLGGFWEFPGGKLEHGEELVPALKRELHEELRITTADEKLLLVKPFVYPHGAVLILFYECKHIEGTPVLTDHDQIQWLTPSELAKQQGLLPANAEVIALLKEAS
jgi:mutator protein MutT